MWSNNYVLLPLLSGYMREPNIPLI